MLKVKGSIIPKKNLQNKKTIADSNIKDETTIEMTLRSKGGMKSETSAASTETIEERRVKRRTSEPCSEISELNEIKLNDITEHFRRQTDNASRRSNEQMKMIMHACHQNTMEQMKSVVRQ